MDSEMLLKVIALTTLLGAVTTYALWIRVRVLLLRQDLFAIRDALFDRIVKLGKLDDPAYRHARDEINGVIRIAAGLSVSTIGYAITCKAKGTPTPTSEDEAVREAVRDAKSKAATRLGKYLLRETLGGIFITCWMWVFPKKVRKDMAETRLNEHLDRSIITNSMCF